MAELEDEDDILRPIPGISLSDSPPGNAAARFSKQAGTRSHDSRARAKAAAKPNRRLLVEEESTQEDEDFEADTEPYFALDPESRPHANRDDDELGSQAATLPLEPIISASRAARSAGSVARGHAAVAAKVVPSGHLESRMTREKENRHDFPNSPAVETQPYVLVKATPTPSLPRKFAAAAASSTATAATRSKPAVVASSSSASTTTTGATVRRGLRLLDSPYQNEAKSTKVSAVRATAARSASTSSSSSSTPVHRPKPTPPSHHQPLPLGGSPQLHAHQAVPPAGHHHLLAPPSPLPSSPGSPSSHFRHSPGSPSPSLSPTSPSSRSQSPSISPSASPSRCGFRLFPFGSVADHHDDRSRLEREKTENAGNSRKRKSTDGATTPAGDGVKRAMRQQEEEPEEEEEMDQDLSHISVSICSPAPAPSPTPTTLSTSSLLSTTGGAGTPCLQQQFTSFHSPFISPTQQLESAPPSPQPVSPFVTDHDATTRKRGHLGSSAPQASPSPADLNLPQPDHAPAAV